LREILALDAVHLSGGAVVDQVEEAGEGIAQIEAAAAAVAHIEDAPHLRVELLLVVEIVRAPRNRLACGRIEAAFSACHATTSFLPRSRGRCRAKRDGGGCNAPSA